MSHDSESWPPPAPDDWAPPQAPEHWPPPGAQSGPPPVTPPAPKLGRAVERPHPLTGVAKSWIALFGLVFVVGRELIENGFEAVRDFGPGIWIFTGLALLVVLLTGIWGVIEWRTTTFVADEDEFRIERNFLSRESSRISYAKIQAVDIERSLAARLLGLASVQIDVGGAGGQKIEFLSRERAESLRDELLRRMRSLARHTDVEVPAVASDHAVPGGTAVVQGQGPGAPPAQPVLEQVIAMSAGTLLLGLFVSSFLPWLLGGIAFLVVMLVVGEGFSIAAVFGVVFGVGGYLWSQIVSNWNFTLTQVPDGLHIRRGLFTKVSKSLKADRIQAVSVHQDYLQRLTGLYRVRVTVLGFSGVGEGGERSDMVLPYGRWEDVRRVLAAFWPGINLDTIPLTGQPDRARWLTPLGFKRHLWGVDEHTLVAHHGWLDHTISLVPHRRMQSIGITQGPLQRRLRLATAAIHTTDGPVNMEVYHLDAQVAREFFDSQVERARVARETPGEPSYLTGFAPPGVGEPTDSDPGEDLDDRHSYGPPAAPPGSSR
ncbi:PH domain-containing protein [Tessaracoccus rhinocerotis]|uniref:PH domain-containing protein n=1 Tax=Tessaracoccus rhinocerotis TaxID=1689449 RepID=A0A553K0T6_9ACTN|nr:PH domain-containing protein [Tessaracoccus rhinocerotis]TRY18313.1 PH domain-containing protein [Tessaracoccus rhinocerotis]